MKKWRWSLKVRKSLLEDILGRVLCTDHLAAVSCSCRHALRAFGVRDTRFSISGRIVSNCFLLCTATWWRTSETYHKHLQYEVASCRSTITVLFMQSTDTSIKMNIFKSMKSVCLTMFGTIIFITMKCRLYRPRSGLWQSQYLILTYKVIAWHL